MRGSGETQAISGEVFKKGLGGRLNKVVDEARFGAYDESRII
jgi:hypothetical protein